MSSLSCPYKFDRSNKSWTFSISSQWEGCAKISQHVRDKSKASKCQFPFVPSSQTRVLFIHSAPLYATTNSPRGFGRPPKKNKKKNTKRSNIVPDDESDDEEEEEEEDIDPDGGVIPEIVTNRMIGRMGITVGIPLFIGLLFFPFFYYLKVIQKIDVPTWVPFIVSFIFFGTALLGISYGIVSCSWDPLREGSLLGWNEAQKNWPVFWQSFRGGSRKK